MRETKRQRVREKIRERMGHRENERDTKRKRENPNPLLSFLSELEGGRGGEKVRVRDTKRNDKKRKEQDLRVVGWEEEGGGGRKKRERERERGKEHKLRGD